MPDIVTIDRGVAAAVCRVVHRRPEGESLGSGVLVWARGGVGRVLTCSHVFDDGPGRTEVRFEGGPPLQATLVARDRANDLAVLALDAPGAEPVEIGSGGAGSPLIVCGFGGGGGLRAARGRLLGAVRVAGATAPSLRIAAPARPGDSGGPVFDEGARLVGVVWGARGAETFAMGGDPLRRILQRSTPSEAPAPPAPTPRPAPPAEDRCEGLAREFGATLGRIESRLAGLGCKCTGSVPTTPDAPAPPWGVVHVVAGALGVSSPLALAAVAAGLLAQRRVRKLRRGPGGPRDVGFPGAAR